MQTLRSWRVGEAFTHHRSGLLWSLSDLHLVGLFFSLCAAVLLQDGGGRKPGASIKGPALAEPRQTHLPTLNTRTWPDPERHPVWHCSTAASSQGQIEPIIYTMRCVLHYFQGGSPNGVIPRSRLQNGWCPRHPAFSPAACVHVHPPYPPLFTFGKKAKDGQNGPFCMYLPT